MTYEKRFTRRSFLVGLGSSTALLVAACADQAAEPAVTVGEDGAPAAEQAGGVKKEVARKDTLIHYGGDTKVQEPTNFNPYSLGGLGRIRGPLNKTIFEFLYYYNHNDGAEIPWLAESYKVTDDFMSINVAIRPGVTWNDGMPFTSDDVKFTLEKLRDTPELAFSSDIKEWVKDVTVSDDQNFTINLNKPNPRFFYFYFIENSEIQVAILPKHIWENEDWTTFLNYDPERGLPVGTGPFKLVEASPRGVFFDRDDILWGAQTGFSQPSKVTRQAFIPLGSGPTTFARMIKKRRVDFPGGYLTVSGAVNVVRRFVLVQLGHADGKCNFGDLVRFFGFKNIFYCHPTLVPIVIVYFLTDFHRSLSAPNVRHCGCHDG